MLSTRTHVLHTSSSTVPVPGSTDSWEKLAAPVAAVQGVLWTAWDDFDRALPPEHQGSATEFCLD
jgi:hypothetical protein